MSRYDYETLTVTTDSGVATVSLNRPQVLNAIDGTMHDELERVWVDVDQDPEVAAVILTGAGRAFSAGGDAKAIQAGAYDPFTGDVFARARRLILALLEVRVPVIAAVNGDAVGLGANMALFCDTVVMSESARIGDPHVRFGVAAGDGGSVIWPMLCGPARAKQYLMTGDLLGAREAERIGLVNVVVGDGEAHAAAIAFARRLCELPPLAVRWTKFAVNKHVREMVNLTLDTSMALESVTLLSADQKEAIAAFLEKRPGSYRGA